MRNAGTGTEVDISLTVVPNLVASELTCRIVHFEDIITGMGVVKHGIRNQRCAPVTQPQHTRRDLANAESGNRSGQNQGQMQG